MIEYKELSKETQLFLNKAMEIYDTIKDKKIVKKVENYGDVTDYEFTKSDKKIFSLFMAGFLVDGKLKDILLESDDIKLDYLFQFIDIKKDDIIKIEEEKYEDFYEKNLKLDLLSIINKKTRYEEIYFFTPAVLLSLLQYDYITGSKILNYFGSFYKIPHTNFGFSGHPLFKKLEAYMLIDGSITKKKFSKNDDIKHPFLFDFSINVNNNKHENIMHTLQLEQTEKNRKPFVIDDNLWKILDEIKGKFIGQEEAAEDLFYNIVNNQQLADMENIPDGQRSIIFVDGPTGTGKTAITREITDKLGIPFVSTSVTNYSATGYVGGNITDVLKELLKKADGDLEKAQRGIVVFDEFDKIAYSRSGGLEMKRAVQQQLLDFLGGGKYNIHTSKTLFNSNEVEFDTSKLTFICLGALTNLRTYKTRRKSTVGFGQSDDIEEEQEYNITPNDLIGIGLERELVGRFNTYLHTNDYSVDSLERILRVSTISPLLGFKKWVESHGKKLIIDEDVYRLIAEQAYELNTGARSLQTVMNNIRTQFIKKVLRENDKVIHLDSETVMKVSSQSMTRRRRG